MKSGGGPGGAQERNWSRASGEITPDAAVAERRKWEVAGNGGGEEEDEEGGRRLRLH